MFEPILLIGPKDAHVHALCLSLDIISNFE